MYIAGIRLSLCIKYNCNLISWKKKYKKENESTIHILLGKGLYGSGLLFSLNNSIVSFFRLPERGANCLPFKHFGGEMGATKVFCLRALLVGPHETGSGLPSEKLK